MPNGDEHFICEVCSADIPYRDHVWAKRDPPRRLKIGPLMRPQANGMRYEDVQARVEEHPLVTVCRRCAKRIYVKGGAVLRVGAIKIGPDDRMQYLIETGQFTL